jgi:hypothetical protein
MSKPTITDRRGGAGVEVKIFAEVDGTRFALATGRVVSEHWTEESEDGIAYVESVNHDDLAEAITNLTKRKVLNEVRRLIGQREIRELEIAAEAELLRPELRAKDLSHD